MMSASAALTLKTIPRKHPVVDMTASSRKSAVELAMKESMHSVSFLDVKFFAFSRRQFSEDGTVRVDKPQHVLAISSVLREVEYFDKLLSGGFAESNGRASVDAAFPEYQAPYTDEYDYESDSDLEDDELEPELEEMASQSRRAGKQRDTSSGVQSASYGGQCQRIVIKDAAYHTWRAFVFYLYFKKVNFLPLKSEDPQARVAALTQALDDPEAIPPCSPKSMYRLAEKYGITDLQDRAFTEIRSQLSPKNIVSEIFSRFTSRYDKVRELEIDFLRAHHLEVDEALGVILGKVAQGEFPHTGELLKTLFDIRMGRRSEASESSTKALTPKISSERRVRPPKILTSSESMQSRDSFPFRSSFAPPPPFRPAFGNVAPAPAAHSAWTTFSPPQFIEDDDY